MKAYPFDGPSNLQQVSDGKWTVQFFDADKNRIVRDIVVHHTKQYAQQKARQLRTIRAFSQVKVIAI